MGFIWPGVYVTKVVTHMATRCLCLGEGQFDILFDRQSASQSACQLQLASQSARWQNINLSGFRLVRYLVTGRVRLTFCLIGSQPASQLANCNWPTNQPCDNISTCQALGWSDIWWQEDREPNHIGPQSRAPALPLVPLGEWPTWPRPGKWHKWALQLLYAFGTTFRDHLQFCI